MVIEKQIDIKKLNIRIKPTGCEPLLAFAEIEYIDIRDQVVLTVRGFRIRKTPKRDGGYWVSVDFPAYVTHRDQGDSGKFEYKKAVYVPIDEWKEIVSNICSAFHQETGGVYVNKEAPTEEVNPDEIPV